jgi:outer membrane protein OmpA-like peptidoglycan-associated protein
MIFRNSRTSVAIVLLPLVLGLTGCAVALIGVGAGIGALSYVNGELVKTYAAEYDEAVRASVGTLKSLKIPVKAKAADELATAIRAERADGTPVTVEVVRVERHLTEIGVRTGNVGIWDLAVSRQIQYFIGQRLAPGPGGAKSVTKYPGSNVPPESPTRATVTQASVSEAQPRSGQKTVPAEAKNQSAKREADGTGTKANQLLASPDRIIFFDQDSNEFAELELEKLSRVAEIILQNPQAEVTIHGYSDATNNPDYNALVAESRGNAVKVYLIGKGVPSKSLTVVNHGSDSSKANHPGVKSNPLRSRVEIEINAF